MKSISVLICVLAFLESFCFGHLDLNDGDAVVGVSQKKLKEYITKALNGFKNVVLKGDEELKYPIMDPYTLEDISWDHIDTSGSNKFSLKFTHTNASVMKGLSNYKITGVDVSAQDLRLSFDVTFSNLQTEIPYKLDGYLFKGIMPVYGEGLLKLFARRQGFWVVIDLAIENGYIIVDDVRIRRYNHNIDVKVTGFMDLSDKFANQMVDRILDPIIKEHGSQAIQTFMQNKVEEAVGGMTMEELFEFFEHFVKKNDKQ